MIHWSSWSTIKRSILIGSLCSLQYRLLRWTAHALHLKTTLSPQNYTNVFYLTSKLQYCSNNNSTSKLHFNLKTIHPHFLIAMGCKIRMSAKFQNVCKKEHTFFYCADMYNAVFSFIIHLFPFYFPSSHFLYLSFIMLIIFPHGGHIRSFNIIFA